MVSTITIFSGYDIYNALVVEVLQGGINTNENVLLVGDSITTGEDAARGTARSWAGLLGGKVNVYNSSRSGTTAAYESTQILGVSGRGIAFDKAIVSLGTNETTSWHSCVKPTRSWPSLACWPRSRQTPPSQPVQRRCSEPASSTRCWCACRSRSRAW